jgi:hypothetical protein
MATDDPRPPNGKVVGPWLGSTPLAKETSLGAASSVASKAGPAPDASKEPAQKEVPLAKRWHPTRAQGVRPN